MAETLIAPRDRWMKILLTTLLALLALSPALWMTHYAARNCVDACNWDMWESGSLLKKWHDGALTWHDLYAPQIQHRIVVPRLIIIALAHLSGGDFRYEQWFCIGLNWLSLCSLWVLMTRAMGHSNWRYGILFFACLLVFSPMHYQTFFWGSSFWMALPMPCLLGALVVLGSRWSLWLKLALALLLAETATHSFSHGLMFWPVILVYLLFQPDLGTLRQRLIASGIWATVGVFTIACYFTEFNNVAFHAYNLRPGDHALKGGVNIFADGNFPRLIRFFLGMFGALHARTPYNGALVADSQSQGIWLVAPCLVIALSFCFTKTGRTLWRAALPFLAVAAYVVGVALAVSAGRAHLGEHRCVLPRYFTVTVFLPLTAVILAFLLGRKLTNGGSLSRHSELIKRLGIAMLCVISALQYPLWQYGRHMCDMWKNARLQGKALTMFLNLDELKPWSMDTLDMEVKRWGFKQTQEQARTMKSLGLLKTPLLETAELRWFKKEAKTLGKDYALIESVKVQGDNLIVVGQARFTSTRSADLILITAEAGDRILALGTPTPLNVVRLFPLDYEFMNGHDVSSGEAFRWEMRMPLASVPAGAVRLDAWALDVQKMSVAKLAQQIELPAAK